MATMKLFAHDRNLAPIREFVVEICREMGLDESVIYALQLAVDEACANAVEHGYGGLGGEIEVTVEPAEGGVRLIMRDWGAAFDPDQVPVPDVAAPLEERPLGGLGLYLMRKVMDDVQFEFDEKEGNTLTMFKRL